MASETDERQRLPFEPAKNRKKQAGKPTQRKPEEPKQTKPKEPTKQPIKQTAVPEIVSQRMISRMAILSGIPTFLGIATFVGSYFVITNKWFDIPNSAVVLTSMAFFGLGVLGLSYGVISASWDEEIPGSIIGWQEFTTNLPRLTAAWGSPEKKRSKS